METTKHVPRIIKNTSRVIVSRVLVSIYNFIEKIKYTIIRELKNQRIRESEIVLSTFFLFSGEKKSPTKTGKDKRT